jgi:hypothetical protein
MTTYRVIIPVQIIMRYDAPDLAGALAQANFDIANHTFPDFLNCAFELFVTDAQPDDGDGAPTNDNKS